MKKSANEIEAGLVKTWPNLRVFVPFDAEYELPASVEAVDAAKAVGKLEPAHGADCDDYALHLLSRIRWDHPFWAFGECFRGPLPMELRGHNLNLCLTSDEGVILINLSPEGVLEWWKPTGENVLWVRM